MKKFTILFSALALCFSSVAQNYYHIKYTADFTKDYIYADFQTMGKIILSKEANDKYSSKQTIPFKFSFYGQDVDEYLASDNGYITFNTSATNSSGKKMALPTGGEPNNAIYAFWNDFELKAGSNPLFPVNIYSYTKGKTPNRTHIIQWFGISVEGKPITEEEDVFAFALVLHERDGTFDVINSTFGSSEVKGTIGAENKDGSKGYGVPGSPNVAFTVSSTDAAADLTVLRFYFGTQVPNDVGIAAVDLPRMTLKGTDVQVKAKIVNFGSNTLKSFDFNYTVDGGTIQTESYTGLNIPASGSINVIHDKNWNSDTSGIDYKFDIYTSNVNTAKDDNTDNDHFGANVLVNTGATTTRTVLVEQGTDAGCGFCPDGDVAAKNINKLYPEVIFLKNHYSDAMQTPESFAVASTFADRYPDLVVDRTVNSSSSAGWANDVVDRMSVGSPASLTIENKSYNTSTRVISYDIKVTFVDDYAGDIRIGSVISEDQVRGPDSDQWSQINFYSEEYPGGVNDTTHEMYQETSPMAGYIHNQVNRAMPNGAWGEEGSIPEVVKKGDSFTMSVTHTLPAMTILPDYSTINNTPWSSTVTEGMAQYGANKPADISVIGFLATYDDYIVRNRPILNAAIEKLWNTSAGIAAKTYSDNLRVYPNPASDFIQIEVDGMTNDADISILDINGKIILKGTIRIRDNTFNVSSLTNGVYLLQVDNNNVRSTERLVINK
jgi:Secretion system C-terminal sorting domain/Outer membrane protein Omp28